MRCSHEKVMKYWSDDLRPSDAEDVRIHLGSCSSCAEFLRSLAHLTEEVQALPLARPGKNLVARAVNRAGTQAQLKRFGIPAVLMAGVVVLVVGLWIWKAVPPGGITPVHSPSRVAGGWEEGMRMDDRIAVLTTQVERLQSRNARPNHQRVRQVLAARSKKIDKEMKGLQIRVARLNTCLTSHCIKRFNGIKASQRRRG
ncbi:MAG: hypothetical protein MI802_05805 [Desulfobacterales bacterium]|nr:hypothetical protein [Desulfobacterales bacterium]